MKRPRHQSGFSLVELLVAAMIFTFVVVGVTQLFMGALDLQRRASGYQRIQENQLFVLESISRAVRVSSVASPDVNCADDGLADADELVIDHPDYGEVTYRYRKTPEGRGYLERSAPDLDVPEILTTDDVDVTRLGFCVKGAAPDDGAQARITIPMTIRAVSSRPSAQVAVSSQTTVVSRDLVEELTN